MVLSRAPLAALVFAALLATVSLVLLGPLSVSAQGPHSGSFTLGDGQMVAIYKGLGDENVLFTVCLGTGGDVEVFGVGTNLIDTVDFRGCHTRKVLVDRIRLRGGAGGSTGTYSVSVSLP